MQILVTGSAGFIGFHLSARLLDRGHRVTGLDTLTPYYDPALKEKRLSQLDASHRYTHHRIDICNQAELTSCLAETRPDVVLHMAAQAGVRYSIDHPQSYIDTNVSGWVSLLQAVRQTKVKHLLAASSSSVYGAVANPPSSEDDTTDLPLSVYAASKKAGEAIGHSYAHLFGIPVTFLRFFTVYGPWGRPDMALFTFARRIMAGQTVTLHDDGRQKRDFTYIDDVVESVCRLIQHPPHSGHSRAVNIGRGHPESVNHLLDVLESALGREAKRHGASGQPGDVPCTHACCERLFALTGYRPATPVRDGVGAFARWYLASSAPASGI